MVCRAFLRVEILALVRSREVSRRESQHAAVSVAYRKHEAVSVKVVVGAALLVPRYEVQFQQQVDVFSPRHGVVAEGPSACRGESQPRLRHVLRAEAFLGVSQCGGGGRVLQLLGVEFRRALVHAPKRFSVQPFLALPVGFFRLVAVNAVALRQVSRCLWESHALRLHHEADGVSALRARPEAVPRLPRRRYVERGRFLLVEGAAACPVCAPLREFRHVFAHQRNDVCPVQYRVNSILANHT